MVCNAGRVLGDRLVGRVAHYFKTGRITSSEDLYEKLDMMKTRRMKKSSYMESVTIKFFRKFYPFLLPG